MAYTFTDVMGTGLLKSAQAMTSPQPVAPTPVSAPSVTQAVQKATSVPTDSSKLGVTAPTPVVPTSNAQQNLATANAATAEQIKLSQADQAQADALAQEEIQAEKKGGTLQGIARDVLGLNTQLQDKGRRTAEIQMQEGVLDNKGQVRDINNQILATRQAFEDQMTAARKNLQGKSWGANDAKLNEMQTEQNSKLARLSIDSLVAEGKYNLALERAQMLVDAEFQPIEAQLATQKMYFEMMRDDLTASEKMQAEADIKAKESQLAFDREKEMTLWNQKIRQNDPLYQAQLEEARTKTTPAPEVKSINGVDMQWNPATKSWDAIAGGDTKKQNKNLTTVNDINLLLNDKNFDTTFGLTNIVGRNISTNPSYVVAQNVANLKASLALAARGELKGQGAVSDFEGKLLEKAQTSLTLNMNATQARRELLQVRGAIMTSSGLSAPVKVLSPDGQVRYGVLDSSGITSAIEQGYTIEYN
jgi:hypothetical protein